MMRATRLGFVLFILLGPPLAVASPAFGRVIVVHVAQTDDPRIGRDCAKDLENVRGLFVNYPAMDQITEFIAIEGPDANHATIMGRLRSLRVGPDDAVMFYYSGHGAEEPGTRENYGLLADGNALYISQVSQTIAAKNPRLNIVIADMCSVIQRPARPPVAAAPMMSAPPTEIPPALRSLFLISRGTAVVISSSSNQVAVGDLNKLQGGIFTSSFVGAIRAKMNQNLTWREVFADAAVQTHQKFVMDNPRGIDGDAAGIPGIGLQQTQTPNVITLDIRSGGGPDLGGGGGGGGMSSASHHPAFGATVRDNGGDGVLVLSSDPGSPAGRIGFERDDVLLQFNGAALRSTNDYIRALNASGPDLHIIFRNCRDGQVYSTNTRIQAGGGGGGGGGGMSSSTIHPAFGATVRDNGGDGVLVLSSDPGSPAGQVGFERDDVLLQFNGAALRSTADYTRALNASGPNLHIVFRNCRDGRVYQTTVRLNK